MRFRLPAPTVIRLPQGLLWLLLAATLAVLLAAAAPQAKAATVTYEGNTVVYSADPGEALNTSVGYQPCVEATSGDCITFHGDAPIHYIDDGSCGDLPDSRWGCALGAGGGVRIVGGNGNDIVSVWAADNSGFPANTPYPIAIDGGAGNDKLVGGSSNETIHGGPGADELIGGGGDDVLYGDDGNDTLRGDGYFNGNESSDGGSDQLYGGAGDDTLTGDSINSAARIGADLLDGGPGTDTVYDDWYRFDGSGGDQDPPPTVTFDGVANDGRPGENDNVVGIEKIDTGYLPNQATPAAFVGSDGPDTINLLFVHGNVSGLGGDDVITGSDYADNLDGGAGNDKISGGFGDDVIVGGPGRDDIGGDRTAACFYGPIYGTCTIGSGNDTIYAQDGEEDTIDCGPGNDVAYVDAIDHVVGCETVHVAPVTAVPPICNATACPVTLTPKPAPTVKVSVSKKLRLRTISRTRKLPVVCQVKGAARCKVRVTIKAKDAKKLRLKVKKHAKAFTLGTKSRTFKKKGKATLTVKLAKKTAKALRRAKKLRVTITATSTAKGRSARTTTLRKTLKR